MFQKTGTIAGIQPSHRAVPTEQKAGGGPPIQPSTRAIPAKGSVAGIPAIQPSHRAVPNAKAASAPAKLGEMPENAVGGAKGKLAAPPFMVRQRLIAKMKGGV